MKTNLAWHVLAEFHECSPVLLQNHELLQSTLLEAARILKTQIINSEFHFFEPFGVSGFVIVAESHLAVHTWPEYGYAALDIFTCNLAMPFEEALAFVEKKLEAQKLTWKKIPRGENINFSRYENQQTS